MSSSLTAADLDADEAVAMRTACVVRVQFGMVLPRCDSVAMLRTVTTAVAPLQAPLMKRLMSLFLHLPRRVKRTATPRRLALILALHGGLDLHSASQTPAGRHALVMDSFFEGAVCAMREANRVLDTGPPLRTLFQLAFRLHSRRMAMPADTVSVDATGRRKLAPNTLEIVDFLVSSFTGEKFAYRFCGGCGVYEFQTIANNQIVCTPMQRCQQCAVLWYCGKECQRAHWKQAGPAGHRDACRASCALRLPTVIVQTAADVATTTVYHADVHDGDRNREAGFCMFQWERNTVSSAVQMVMPCRTPPAQTQTA
jgi:hypothetical protein